MNIADFIKLPASEASWLYRHHRDAGDTEEASRLHQAYFETHRIKLSDEGQIAAAEPHPVGATVTLPQRAVQKRERSKVRRVGIVLSGTGAAVGLFAAAAGIGAAGLAIGMVITGGGFALWLVGVLEDRLIEVAALVSRHA